MDKKKLEEIIEQAPNENEQWDFKQEWHHSNGELLRDILNFVNTPSHDDCYIIFGVNDKDGSIIGINDDRYKKDKQQLQDFLRKQPFSQNYYPKTNVESFDFDGKKVDVLTIYNTSAVPLFLTKDVARLNNEDGKRIGKPLQRGLIYSRINDSNTPVDESTTDDRMQELWQKRFRLDVSVYERAKFVLKDYDNWTYIKLIANDRKYIYTKDPDFVVEIVDDDMADSKDQFAAFSLDQDRTKIYWNKVKLNFRDTTIYENYYLYLNSTDFGTVVPDRYTISLPNLVDDGIAFYYYFYRNDFPILISKLIDHISHVYRFSSEFSSAKFDADVIIFENKEERKNIEKKTKDYIYDNFDKMKKWLYPSTEDIKTMEHKVQLDIDMSDFKRNRYQIPLLMFDNKLVQLMQQFKIMMK